MSTLLVQPAAETKIGSRIPTLDGWRGIAILLVLCEHAGQYGRFKNQMWTNLGSSGVDIFFVLSGFIITTRLIQERANHASIDLRAFYLRRAFRILPLVVIYLLALCLISRFADLADFHWQEVVGSLFFFRNYQFTANPHGLYTTHFWSLSIEEHFYLGWPALLLWLGNRRALRFAIIGAAASALWRFYQCGQYAQFHIFPSARPALHALQTDARLDGLLLGSALALLLTNTRVQAFILTNFQRESPIILLPAIVLNLLLVGGHPSLTLYLLVGVTLAYTLVVKEGFMFRWLNLPPLVWVGEISYSLYIWQQLFLLHPPGHLPLGRLSVFPLHIACAFAAAACSFYFMERPMIKLGKRLYVRKVYDPRRLLRRRDDHRNCLTTRGSSDRSCF
jgi:peptidoglycan/LPS O-acetylase OafA/YrhL